MIPEAAVEAAGQALDEAGYGIRSSDELRTALEAAAPYLRQAFYLEMNLKAVREEMTNTIYPLGKIEDKRT